MSYSQSICAACRRALLLKDPLSVISTRRIQHEARRNLSTTSATTPSLSAIQRSRISTARRWNIEERLASQSRAFSSSRTLAKVIQNQRVDEDGNEMVLQITPRASNRLKQISTKEQKPQLLRITVESGGCHGFQYLMSLSTPEKVDPEEDTVIEADDGTGSKIVLDEPSLELLKGSKVDYTMELIGSQFKIVDNPAASSSCGCGTSFDVKGL